MKTTRLFLAIATLFLTACNCSKPAPVTPDEPDPEVKPKPVPTPSFAKGADISWVSEMEKDGRTFQLKAGTKADIMDVLKETGVNAIRLRVWVNPTGGWSGKDDVVKLATRAAKAGMALMVDFHYSDFFADPSRQTIPAAWEADKNDLDKMAKHVSDHTAEVLKALQDAGVTPNWVQVGNETRNGMLFGSGDLKYDDKENEFSRFLVLYNTGYDAVKAVFPTTLVMPHIDKAFDLSNDSWWLSNFKKQGGKFDMIALSHYPQESWNGKVQIPWETANTQAINNIKAFASSMGVPIIISEVGVKTPANEKLAAQVLAEFMTEAKKINKCAGVFYWEPEVDGNWKPALFNLPDVIYKYTGKKETWNPYDMGAFTTSGKATSVMEAFK